MSDRRRHLHRAPAGASDTSALPSRPRAVVIGAGIAGLAAATGLAERGVAVDVIERERYLGGRVGGWNEQHHGADIAMNRGFHAFFRQYYNLRALLARIDPRLGMLVPVEDYPLIDAVGRRDGFRGLPRTPPWNALMFALRSPTFRFRDLIRLDASAAAPLAAVSVPAIYERLDHIDAETFLKSINFPAAARHLAFEVFSRSFFADPVQLSAAELVTMFHIYFLGSNEGLVFDVPDANYDSALWNPLRQYLETLGVRFQLETDIARIEVAAADSFRVHSVAGDRADADAVVLATDIAGLQRITAASTELGDAPWRARIGRLRTAPPFAVQRLWLDQPVAGHRPAFLGTAGHEPLDNISVLDRYEREARDWLRQQHGSVVELHSYALASPPAHGAALRQLHRVYPETRTAAVRLDRTLIRDDCPLFAPGSHADRPGVATPHPRLVLAGDGVRIDWPVALMERAASTGFSAANRLLAGWGVTGHDLYTVPNRGRSAPLRWRTTHRKRSRR